MLKKKKNRSVSKEDTNQFFILRKIQIAPKGDANQFVFYEKKNSDLHLMKMKPSFLFEKNLDLHLMKMQIHFYFEEKFRSTSNEIADLFLVLRKRIDYM